jgi:WD40 repeat protein
VIVWDAATGKQSIKLSGHTDSIYSVAFSPDSTKIASSSYDTTVRIWDVGTGKLLMTLNQPEGSKGVAWSADGKFIAAGTDIAVEDGHIMIWDVTTGKQKLDIPVGNTRVATLAFSPDGTHVLAGLLEAHRAGVWDTTTGEQVFDFAVNSENVSATAYSHDGKLIAIGSHDGTASIWDAASGEQLFMLFTSGTVRMAFSPDDKYLATQNLDGTTRIYVVQADDLMALAQSRLTRWWTADECKRYLHMDTCPAKP